jgi:putative hydrolase of the HAD superfamily
LGIAGGIEVVLFDYGQVLSAPPDPEAWARMLAITGLAEEPLHEGYWAFRHAYDRGELTGREYWCALADRTAVALSETQVDALLVADVDLWTRPNPPMIAWAGQLQRAVMRTAVLSNVGDAMAAGLTARLNWLNRFERCVWSYALRLAKPEPEIFRETLNLLGVLPERVLFVDDKEENVAAARALGIEAIRYTNDEEFEQEMRERGLGVLLVGGKTVAALVEREP